MNIVNTNRAELLPPDEPEDETDETNISDAEEAEAASKQEINTDML